MASRPVPAEGSSTRSAGVIAAAMLGDEAERDRRRELLERLALLGAARVRRQQRREPWPAWRAGTPRRRARAAHGGPEFAQEQDLRRLAGVVGGLPVPGAFGVGTAEGCFIAARSAWASMARPAFEIGQQQAGGGEQREPESGGEGVGAAREAAANAAAERGMKFMREIQESGNGANRRVLSLDPGRLKPVPAALSLSLGKSCCVVRW